MSKAFKAVGNLIFGKAPKPEKPPPPIPLPDPESAAANLEAVRKARARSRRGREGTIYSQASGTTYSSSGLGGTA